MSHALIDVLLDRHKDALGRDFAAYGNHVHRVFDGTLLHQRHLAPGYTPSDDEMAALAIAAVYHDAAIWLDGTFDYLDPSNAHAQAELKTRGLERWSDAVFDMVMGHHKLTSVPPRGDDPNWGEWFRRADYSDVSWGLVRFGVPAADLKAVRSAYPNLGFHKALVRIAGGWFPKHPFNPMPMMRW